MNLRRLMNKPEPLKIERPWNIEWEMKDKTIALSHDMSNTHLRNCIKMLDDKILNLTIHALDDHKSRVLTFAIDESIAEWHKIIKVFKLELTWRNQNSTYINKTKIRKGGKF